MIMNNYKNIFRLCFACCLMCASMMSCTDKFDDEEGNTPSWLGDNIYDYLLQRGDCSQFLQLIDDEGLTETMQLTGSNTVFFANDDAFNRFYQNNNMGIHSYKDMPNSLKKLFLRFGVIENAQLIERLARNDRGQVLLRRTTNMEVLDTIPVVASVSLPDNEYFKSLREKGKPVYLLQDASQWTLVQFFPEVMKDKGITDEDLQFITKSQATTDSAYLYSTPVINQNITCKNGYLHEISNLLLPPDNMAGYIATNGRTNLFNHLMDRFCLPVFYDRTADGDTIWQKVYFNNGSRPISGYTNPETKVNVSAPGLLVFDPGWNLYASPTISGSQPYEQTMACMFVPTDEAMDQFFSPTGEGSDFYEAFGTWDNVPTAMVADIINSHMKNNFLQALPSKFTTVEDENGYNMGVSVADVEDKYVARNGMIYVTNKVYAPQDYKTVMGPAKIDLNNSVFNLAISNTTYSYYAYLLRAPKNTYYFFVTPDEKMKGYVDPASMGYANSDYHTKLDFYLNSANQIVATPISIATGDTIRDTGYPMGSNGIVNSGMRSRMNEILGTQTIVASYDGEVEERIADGQQWFVSNSYAPVHIKSLNVGGQVKGSGNVQPVKITRSFKKSNGRTFEIDGLIQNTTTSIRELMESNSDFNEFFKICDAIGIFSNTLGTNAALNYRVSFLNQYHYTVYIPTNQAIIDAQVAGKLPTKEQYENEGDAEKKDSLKQVLTRFVRYHFQDNSIFVNGKKEECDYLSSTLNQTTNKFYPIHVKNTGSAITLKSVKGTVATVDTSDGHCNLLARDVVVNTSDRERATEVGAYAYAVLHQIDKILDFE